MRISESYDVIVCGGGPAGVSAAVRAGREGCRVLLIEKQGALGGTWTAGLMTWILDGDNKKGIFQEIVDRIATAGSLYGVGQKDHSFLPEHMKYVMEQLTEESGVILMYHASVVSVRKETREGLPYISGVIVESGSGRQVFGAKVVIDATGDGDAAYHAGCTYDMGSEEHGIQPMSMIALVAGLRPEDVKEYCLNEETAPGQAQKRFHALFRNYGIEVSYSMPVLTHLKGDVFSVSINHEYHVSCEDAFGVTRATIHGRKEIVETIGLLKQFDPAWKNVVLVQTSEAIGVREGRRIHGRYCLTKEDLAVGRQFEDGICNVTFNVDIHEEEKEGKGAWQDGGIKIKPYQIPLRALIAAEVSGLLLAGRLISGDFYAHASYRVGGNAVAIGEVCGLLAALSVKTGMPPEKITSEKLKKALNIDC